MAASDGPRPSTESFVEVCFVLEYKHENMLVDLLNFKGVRWVPSFGYYLPDVDGSNGFRGYKLADELKVGGVR